MIYPHLLSVFFGFLIYECGAKEGECGLTGIICSKYETYRTISGACNNLKNPRWGTMNSTYDRLVPPQYGPDGSLTLSITGGPLPNARTLSLNIFTDATVTDKHVTLSAMQYGQFVAHDMSFTFLIGSPLDCCTDDFKQLDEYRANCASVDVPYPDPYYSTINITCLSLVRTTTNYDLNCSSYLKYKEQITEANNFLDLSVIYGHTDEVHRTLRTYVNGTLLVDIRNGNEWIPQCNIPTMICPRQFPTHRCYRTGDPRVNQNPQLTILHMIWTREHNRIARVLQALNPHWDDETLFQEARRIAIAEHQFITYYELLPIYLDGQRMLRNGLIHDTDGYVNDYDVKMRPHVFNEHAQAAFKHFHSMVSGNLDLVDNTGCPYSSVNLRDTLFAPHFIEERDNYDSLIRGLNTQPAVAPGINLFPEMSRHAFLVTLKYSIDIKSIDIQRARDHGMASYNDLREFCGLPRAEYFYHFLDVIDKERIELLQKYYFHPDDVDLLVGGDMERKIAGTLVGPTFLCIMNQQFLRTRRSDRFWFENIMNGFTPDQLREIRKTSISRILCDNGNDIHFMQRSGFLQVSPRNPRLPCEMLPRPNLEYWGKYHHQKHRWF